MSLLVPQLDLVLKVGTWMIWIEEEARDTVGYEARVREEKRLVCLLKFTTIGHCEKRKPVHGVNKTVTEKYEKCQSQIRRTSEMTKSNTWI